MINVGSFVPKQAIRKDVDLYAEITANSTRDVARRIVEMVPPLGARATVHDNGCGAGEVTSVIMEAHPPNGISIEATDIDQPYLDRFQALALEHRWPVRIANMGADRLRFADDVFDLSVANFVVFLTPGGGVPAVREMWRTLRSGGTAVFTAWACLPHVGPVKAAHEATRGPEASPLREIPPEWWLGSHLQKVALDAGFEQDKTQLRTARVHMTVQDEQHLAQVLWSYLGPPVAGWLPSDEDNWDKAIDVILRTFRETEGFERRDESAATRIELTANVLIARK
ncbi:S-adenosyl-L-methionine-dependent methyltransferase [Melanomma pulvis-pyrius CBS 109.77]|uniref:S-adenosyl-L-methionine-dependent methyltransferase n=1 Tax=Melanomma pulvis-pyrius CBS 109.77 TaxID=1314802 RepID=A0A6A6X0D4_9PLEO|nr:S-adenosyl-L-methionine-dependent methyltransferase [Melanomma pulvis-pyrius CBS 109.77]